VTTPARALYPPCHDAHAPPSHNPFLPQSSPSSNSGPAPSARGWDQTGSNGANLSFPVEFGIAAPAGSPNFDRDNWLVGLVNSAPYIASAFMCVVPLPHAAHPR
jgi:hypothetical protein